MKFLILCLFPISFAFASGCDWNSDGLPTVEKVEEVSRQVLQAPYQPHIYLLCTQTSKGCYPVVKLQNWAELPETLEPNLLHEQESYWTSAVIPAQDFAVVSKNLDAAVVTLIRENVFGTFDQNCEPHPELKSGRTRILVEYKKTKLEFASPQTFRDSTMLPLFTK